MKEGARPVSCADDILSKLESETPGSFDLSLLLTERMIPDFDATVKRYDVSLSPGKGGAYAPRAERLPEPETLSAKPVISPDLSSCSDVERAVYDALETPRTPDELASVGFSAPQILAVLTTLEIAGLIRSLPGGRYERAN